MPETKGALVDMGLSASFNVKEFVFGTARFGPVAGWESADWKYPLDTDFTLQNPEQYYEPRDPDGIPMHSYASVGRQYTPSRVMAWGLTHWNRRTSAGHASESAVLQAAEWLSGFSDGRFLYCFDWGKNKSPWISCLAQGMGISLLLRAATLRPDDGFQQLARRAMDPMLVGVDRLGVLGQIDGGAFLEEYPGDTGSHVLNGCLYSMIGLIDLLRYDDSQPVHDLLDSVGSTLERTIDRWDMRGWSSYDLTHEINGGHWNACTPGYQALNATLLAFVAGKCGLSRCQDVATRWQEAGRNPLKRLNAMRCKIRYRLRFPAQS